MSNTGLNPYSEWQRAMKDMNNPNLPGGSRQVSTSYLVEWRWLGSPDWQRSPVRYDKENDAQERRQQWVNTYSMRLTGCRVVRVETTETVLPDGPDPNCPGCPGTGEIAPGAPCPDCRPKTATPVCPRCQKPQDGPFHTCVEKPVCLVCRDSGHVIDHHSILKQRCPACQKGAA